ncbi:MAG: hypothetical protein PHE00_00290 [Atribacterota bacterium]|nr:hypothetical protein [Atribacterota bacterium]
MLKKIINELKNSENEANRIIDGANNEAQKQIAYEKEQLEIIKDDTIKEWNKKGQAMVDDRVKMAEQKANEIYENSKEEKNVMRKSLKNKYDKAIEMIINELVK